MSGKSMGDCFRPVLHSLGQLFWSLYLNSCEEQRTNFNINKMVTRWIDVSIILNGDIGADDCCLLTASHWSEITIYKRNRVGLFTCRDELLVRRGKRLFHLFNFHGDVQARVTLTKLNINSLHTHNLIFTLSVSLCLSLTRFTCSSFLFSLFPRWQPSLDAAIR